MWGRGQRGNNAACSALYWPSVTCPATHKQIGPFWCDSLVGGFVYVLGPCGSLQQTLLCGWEFLPLPQPPQVFSVRSFEALFPHAGNLGCAVSHSPVVPPGLSAHKCGTARSASHRLTSSASRCLATSPLCPTARLHPSCNSLVVGLPYSSIFCQFWLFFCF